MKKYLHFWALLLLCFLLQLSCGKEENGDLHPALNISQFPYDKLSDYQFFEGALANLEPIDKVLPYELNTPLFSDYSFKARFVFMPDGKSATYTKDDIVDFPVGTIIIKTFYYLHDFRDESKGKNIIETRLLVKQANEWDTHSYIWNETQDEAFFSLIGDQREISWIHKDGSTKTANYLIPNKNECKNCHKIDDVLVPIGPKARNLNGMYDYESGRQNQLEKWQEMGYLTAVPSTNDLTSFPKWVDPSTGNLEERARAYIDVNCAHCHNPNAHANNSGLFLHYTNDLLSSLGVCKSPVAAGSGSGGLRYSIVPGNPEASIMVYRMDSNEIDEAMPEIGRSVIHEEGLALIREWIAAMDPSEDCQ